MDILAGVILSLLTGLVGAYIALRMLKPNIKVANSQEQSNLAKALKDAVDAFVAVSADRTALEKRVDELEAHRNERSQQISAMQSEIDNLKTELRKYVNAYARAIRYIHEKISDVDIPDFLLESKPK